ncbi:ATP-grasp fold amidoligase family protein [Escherichia coli]
MYFGELTFAPGSGSSPFTNKGYDLWMGNMWHKDPAN